MSETDKPLPEWRQDTILGAGNPKHEHCETKGHAQTEKKESGGEVKPTAGKVYVEKEDGAASVITTIDSTDARFKVIAVAEDIVKCHTGDYILFNRSQNYKSGGKDYIVVDEADIDGVEAVN